MENAEETSVNGAANLTEEGKKVNGDAKSVEGRGKCGKCTKSRAGKESPAAKQQQTKVGKSDEGNKSLEQLKKALNSVTSPDEKVTMICEKYADLLEDNRKLALALKQGEKKVIITQKEKELAQAEHSKVILTRSRLENLCRELQHQNKAIKEESLARIKDEEEKRKELSARFNVTLNEITTLMKSNTEKNNQLREENKALTDKFKIICEQYEMRETQVEKLMQQNTLENKLGETKLAKCQVEMMQEKELLLRELSSYQTQLKQMVENENALRSQITMYSDKYEEFQGALTKSNDVFSSFKSEMEKMSKKIIRLEKETSTWKSRWENSHQALLEMAADKQQRDEDLIRVGKQVLQLQRLCRTMQEERTKHIAKLRDYGEDLGQNQPAPEKKEEVDELLESEPTKPKPIPMLEAAPINNGADGSAEEIKTESSGPGKEGTDEAAKEQTEKITSEETSVSTSDNVIKTDEPVPEQVPEKPSANNKTNQPTPNSDKKKAKEGGRKKKK